MSAAATLIRGGAVLTQISKGNGTRKSTRTSTPCGPEPCASSSSAIRAAVDLLGRAGDLFEAENGQGHSDLPLFAGLPPSSFDVLRSKSLI